MTERDRDNQAMRPEAATATGCTHGRLFAWSILVFAVLKLLLMPALPLVVSYDSMHYLDLSRVWEGTRAWQTWDYMRTPGFPYYLYAVAQVWGITPGVFILTQTLLGTIAAILLACALRRHAGRPAALAFLLLMLGFPLVVGYEHVLLTETVNVLLVAAVVAAALLRSRWWPVSYLFVGTVVGMGYMVRQSFVALLVPALLVTALRHRRPHGAVTAVLVAMVLGGAAYAGMTTQWKQRQKASGAPDRGAKFLLFCGAFNYGLIDPTIEAFAPAREVYEELLRQCPDPGDAGYSKHPKMLPIRQKVLDSSPEAAGDIAMQSLRGNLVGYLSAVGKNLRLMYGITAVKSNRSTWERSCNSIWPVIGMRPEYKGNCMVGEPYLARAKELFEQRFQRGWIAQAYDALRRPYLWIVLTASWMTILAGIVWLAKRDWATGILCLAPHGYILLHAVLLTSVDRYAFPVYPLMLCMAVWSLARLAQQTRSARRSRANGRSGRPIPMRTGATDAAVANADTADVAFAETDVGCVADVAEAAGAVGDPAVAVQDGPVGDGGAMVLIAAIIALQAFANCVLQPFGAY